MINTDTPSLPDIDSPYPLTVAQVTKFRNDGYIKLKNVFSRGELATFRPEITRLVKELNTQTEELENRNTYGRAFLQIENLWTHSITAKTLVFSRRLARIATELLGTRGVRLYHDQALYKECGGGVTPWHVDQTYWPLSNENTVTAWIPLHEVPPENGPLSFAIGSQKIQEYRNLTISDESEEQISRHMKISDYPVDESPYDLGEVSFHYGYTFHRAGPNNLDTPREVMTCIYMDSDMRLAEPKSQAQRRDRDNWCPGIHVGDVIDSPLNPQLY